MTEIQLETLSSVVSLAIGGSPISFVVIGLVEYAKRLGITGRTLLIISMALGCVIGGAYLYSTARPTDLFGFLVCGIYGLLLGLVASGIYDGLGRIKSAS